MKKSQNETLIGYAADISAAAANPDTAMGMDAAEKLNAYAHTYEPEIRAFRLSVLLTAADLISTSRSVDEDTRRNAEQIAAQELIGIAGFVIQVQKARRGEDFSPARFALVSYGTAASLPPVTPNTILPDRGDHRHVLDPLLFIAAISALRGLVQKPFPEAEDFAVDVLAEFDRRLPEPEAA